MMTKLEMYSELEDPVAILSHMNGLKEKGSDAPPHIEIMGRLLKQVEKIDFERQAFPESNKIRTELSELPADSKRTKDLLKVLEKFKLTNRHYIVLSIENVLILAEKNRWGLSKKHDFIYLYNGTHWSEVDKEGFQQFLGKAAEKQGVEKFSAKFFLFRDQLFKQFLSTAHLPTPITDCGKVLINLQNGTFEISSSNTKLRPFDPGDFLTYQLPFKYDKQAKAPVFEAYLNKVLPDKERQRVLAEYMGFIFIKHGSNSLKEEKALILYGTGANGKSVFFEVVNALLGAENVASYSLQSLTNDNGYFRAKLANKLVNYASEINGNLEASVFKQLVSGEPVEARLPYGQPFILKQYAKLIFNCNELPRDVEHTNAYFRRFLIIPFDVTIPANEQDKNLHRQIIENELSGVFNWVLDGLGRLLAQKGFSECRAAEDAVKKYRIESDSVQMYLMEHEYAPSISGATPLKDMFGEYRAYCSENGFRPVSMRTFSERLRSAGYTMEKKNYGQSVFGEKRICRDF